jgi:hypothetical protein
LEREEEEEEEEAEEEEEEEEEEFRCNVWSARLLYMNLHLESRQRKSGGRL